MYEKEKKITDVPHILTLVLLSSLCSRIAKSKINCLFYMKLILRDKTTPLWFTNTHSQLCSIPTPHPNLSVFKKFMRAFTTGSVI